MEKKERIKEREGKREREIHKRKQRNRLNVGETEQDIETNGER